jgi:hypothetical protein
MQLLLEVFSWAVIVCGVVTAGIGLHELASRRRKGQSTPEATSSSWRTVRVCWGAVLISCANLAGGVVLWLLSPIGVWLALGWDVASWLRTRYRLTRMG